INKKDFNFYVINGIRVSLKILKRLNQKVRVSAFVFLICRLQRHLFEWQRIKDVTSRVFDE
ncbi:MAG: hypothetical protein LBL00_00590, partial [Endomicrobium sp.]|nr:hypothetical protein [Endomicrobium sp.]